MGAGERADDRNIIIFFYPVSIFLMEHTAPPLFVYADRGAVSQKISCRRPSDCANFTYMECRLAPIRIVKIHFTGTI